MALPPYWPAASQVWQILKGSGDVHDRHENRQSLALWPFRSCGIIGARGPSRDGKVSRLRIGILVFCLLLPTSAMAAEAESWAVHGQATFVEQFHPAFHSSYSGASSMFGDAQGRETLDATLYVGVSPWAGGEAWADMEMDQGFGLSNTLGAAAFPSAEAYKVGKSSPYGRLQRLFFRQTIDLGGEEQAVEGDANQLGGAHTANTLILTGGKFSVADIFDTNAYAHDARGD